MEELEKGLLGKSKEVVDPAPSFKVQSINSSNGNNNHNNKQHQQTATTQKSVWIKQIKSLWDFLMNRFRRCVCVCVFICVSEAKRAEPWNERIHANEKEEDIRNHISVGRKKKFNAKEV